MLNRIFRIHNQKGFTLVEMLIAVAISGLIVSSIVAVVTQTISITVADRSQTTAIKQVENALHWIDRDGQMASSKLITPSDSTITNFPLVLSWTEFIESKKHIVTYTIVGGVLKRTEIIKDKDDNLVSTITSQIASNIDPTNSNYAFNGKILQVNLIAKINDFKSSIESRTLYVIPRVSK